MLAQYVRFGAPPTAPSYVKHYVTAYSVLLADYLAVGSGRISY